MPVGYRGAIFDVDGVLVDSPHERAWRETLQLLMESDCRGVQLQTTYTPGRFALAVYREVVASKPRLSGVRAALAYFSVPDAEEHEVPTQDCFVEDATSGVQAAKAGDMAALGAARLGEEELLHRAGADFVVTTLDDIDLDALAEGRLERKSR